MRAALLYGPEDLRVERVPDPESGEDAIVVEVEAATTCGTDGMCDGTCTFKVAVSNRYNPAMKREPSGATDSDVERPGTMRERRIWPEATS